MGVTEDHAILVNSMHSDKSTLLCGREMNRLEGKLFYCFNAGRFIVYRVRGTKGLNTLFAGVQRSHRMTKTNRYQLIHFENKTHRAYIPMYSFAWNRNVQLRTFQHVESFQI